LATFVHCAISSLQHLSGSEINKLEVRNYSMVSKGWTMAHLGHPTKPALQGCWSRPHAALPWHHQTV